MGGWTGGEGGCSEEEQRGCVVKAAAPGQH